jgi:hypothetical protein
MNKYFPVITDQYRSQFGWKYSVHSPTDLYLPYNKAQKQMSFTIAVLTITTLSSAVAATLRDDIPDLGKEWW